MASLVVVDALLPGCDACWGYVSAANLQPFAIIRIFSTAPEEGFFAADMADGDGSATINLNFPCGAGFAGVHAESTTWDNQPITSNTVDSPCEPYLRISTDSYPCDAGQCWGVVDGIYLMPDSEVSFYATAPAEGLFGTSPTGDGLGFRANLNLQCGGGWTGVYATALDMNGTPLTTDTVDSQCDAG